VQTQLLEEYKEAGQNMRHYANHLAVFLAMFVVATGGLSGIALGINAPKSDIGVLTIRAAGVVVSLAFWLMTESASHLWRHFMLRAAAIEPQLGFKIYTSIRGYPNFRIRPGMWAVRILFIGAIAFWSLSELATGS
jgi:hypothetical protein